MILLVQAVFIPDDSLTSDYCGLFAFFVSTFGEIVASMIKILLFVMSRNSLETALEQFVTLWRNTKLITLTQ